MLQKVSKVSLNFQKTFRGCKHIWNRQVFANVQISYQQILFKSEIIWWKPCGQRLKCAAFMNSVTIHYLKKMHLPQKRKQRMKRESSDCGIFKIFIFCRNFCFNFITIKVLFLCVYHGENLWYSSKRNEWLFLYKSGQRLQFCGQLSIIARYKVVTFVYKKHRLLPKYSSSKIVTLDL